MITGLTSVMVDYSLTSGSVGDGFGFTYGLEFAPAPEAGKGVLALAALALAGLLTRARGLRARG